MHWTPEYPFLFLSTTSSFSTHMGLPLDIGNILQEELGKTRAFIISPSQMTYITVDC